MISTFIFGESMNKIIFKIFIKLTPILSVMLFVVPAFSHPTEGDIRDRRNWLSTLPNSIRLQGISIPGTHESMAESNLKRRFFTTDSSTIRDNHKRQSNQGILSPFYTHVISSSSKSLITLLPINISVHNVSVYKTQSQTQMGTDKI